MGICKQHQDEYYEFAQDRDACPLCLSAKIDTLWARIGLAESQRDAARGELLDKINELRLIKEGAGRW